MTIDLMLLVSSLATLVLGVTAYSILAWDWYSARKAKRRMDDFVQRMTE